MENQPTRSVSNILCFKNEDGKTIVLFLTLCLYNIHLIIILQMVPLVQSSVDSLVEVFGEKVEKGESFEFFRYTAPLYPIVSILLSRFHYSKNIVGHTALLPWKLSWQQPLDVKLMFKEVKRMS